MNQHKWENVLLTSAGFYDSDDKPRKLIIDQFTRMLNKPFDKAKVLFIPTAALPPNDMNWEYANWCKNDLLLLGIPSKNIFTYDIDGSLSEQYAMMFDVIFFTGGNTPYLAKRVRETHFDQIIKNMVYKNKVYVGISAGSMLAMPDFNVDNLPVSDPAEFTGLGFINAYFTVHCAPDTLPRNDLSLQHIPLTDNQALTVSWNGYKIIGGENNG